MITVGTNLGGCFVQQGRIWHGASFSAGEIGYLRLHNEKRILEDVASTRAMIREAAFSHNMSPSEITGEMVFDWAREGDEEAMASIEVLASNLGEGLAAVCCLLNPEVIVLGGGVMAQHEILGPLLEKRLEQLVMPAMRAKTRLVFAALGGRNWGVLEIEIIAGREESLLLARPASGVYLSREVLSRLAARGR